MSEAYPLFIYTETSTHAGTGAGLGAIDLPIQREKTTGYPIIQGSGVKGALRSQCNGSKEDISIVFGPENLPEYAGAATFGDARLLAFPVRSAQGVTAWATSVDLLARFVRETVPIADQPPLHAQGPQSSPLNSQIFVSSSAVVADNRVLLEEYLYNAIQDETTTMWGEWLAYYALPNTKAYNEYYKRAFAERFMILPNEDLRDFALYATEVITRVKLDSSTKTVVDGALFTQELLPADTLLYVPVQAYQARAEDFAGTSFEDRHHRSAGSILQWLGANLPQRMQIGGDETIGKGFVALSWGGGA